MILNCMCEHKFQDKKYGKGRRVHNPTKKTPLGKIYRCTVCEREKNIDTGNVIGIGGKK